MGFKSKISVGLHSYAAYSLISCLNISTSRHSMQMHITEDLDEFACKGHALVEILIHAYSCAYKWPPSNIPTFNTPDLNSIADSTNQMWTFNDPYLIGIQQMQTPGSHISPNKQLHGINQSRDMGYTLAAGSRSGGSQLICDITHMFS